MLGNLMTVVLTCLVLAGILLVVPALSAVTTGRNLLSRLQMTERPHGTKGLLIAAVAVFVIVAGIGAGTSYFGGARDVPTSSPANAADDSIERLKSYTRSIAGEQETSKSKSTEPLADVNTMIDRLAARLKTAPDDAKGWRMLGWSYFHTARFNEAVPALARALELDPSSDELKRAYEDAQAKAAEAHTAAAPSSPPATIAPTDQAGANPSAEQVAAYQAMAPDDRNSAIRSMVDGLAARLESAPNDIEGWARLMRSRVVLGEKENAVTAFRKALDVFKEDPAAARRLAAAAAELGLNTR